MRIGARARDIARAAALRYCSAPRVRPAEVALRSSTLDCVDLLYSVPGRREGQGASSQCASTQPAEGTHYIKAMKRRGAHRLAQAEGLTESSASAAGSVASEPLEQPAKEVMRTVRALLKEACVRACLTRPVPLFSSLRHQIAAVNSHTPQRQTCQRVYCLCSVSHTV